MTTGTAGRTDREREVLEAQFRHVFDADPGLAGLSEAALRVLSTAAVLFYRRGCAATSVRELGRACGLSPGAFYNHFTSRDEVLYVLARTGHQRVEQAVDDALAAIGWPGRAGGAAPEVALQRFVTAYTERHLAFPAFAQLVHREYVHLSGERRAEIVECRRRIREKLVEILRAGAASGRFTLIDGPDPAVGQAMMVLDMCSRTSEWFNSAKPSTDLTERYVTAALRLVGAGLP